MVFSASIAISYALLDSGKRDLVDDIEFREGREVFVADQPRPPISVGDIASVTSLGRDLEVGVFAITPHTTSMILGKPNEVGPSEVKVETVYRETARLRLGPSAAGHLALNLAMAIRTAHPVDFAAFRSAFESALAGIDRDEASAEVH